MAATSQSSEPDIPDNHKDSWLALLSAAEAYCQKSGCELAILTAWKKFPWADGRRTRDSAGAFPKDSDFSYGVWGQGFLAESARRYVDDIGVLHSTTMLMAQKHTRQAPEGGAKAPAHPSPEAGHAPVGAPAARVRSRVAPRSSALSRLQGLPGDGGVGGVSPSAKMFPSVCGAGKRGGGQAGERGRDKGPQEAQRGRGRSGIGDVDEACEDEDEDEEEDEQRAYGTESAGRAPEARRSGGQEVRPPPPHVPHPFLLQVFSPWTRTRCPGTASPSGRTARRRARTVSALPPPLMAAALLSFLCPLRLAERGGPPSGAGRGRGPAGVPPEQRGGAGSLAARVGAGVELQKQPLGSGRQRRAGEREVKRAQRARPPRP